MGGDKTSGHPPLHPPEVWRVDSIELVISRCNELHAGKVLLSCVSSIPDRAASEEAIESS